MGFRILRVCLFLFCVLSASALSAKVLYVSSGGDDTSSGESWETARRSITESLKAAEIGDEIWVAEGTYYESITLVSGVALYGGFTGNETARYQRNWNAHPTILDGSQLASVVTFPTNSSVKTRLDGFTVRNGGNTSYGGGINCPSGCQGVVANNQIMNNMASNGAGIACVSASSTLINNLILRNTASGLGGGIYLSNSSAQVINNTVLENSAPGSSPNKGGGITCIGTPSASIYNNIIAFNTSGIYSSSSTPVLKCNCLYGNAEYQYSGVAVGAGDISSDPLFYDRVNDDYHLDLSSPCKDKGYDAPVKASWVDLDGEARIFGSHVDIGFDEFHDDLTALAPVMDPEGGTYNGTISVQLISATTDSVIHYTTNGNVPSESDSIANGPVVITTSCTLKSRAFKSGLNPSRTQSAAYTLRSPVIYVYASASSPSHDGLSWKTAYLKVSDALSNALPGDEIWVAAGKYQEQITIRNNVSLYGGFVGTETMRWQRNFHTNQTILDGQAAGTVIQVNSGVNNAARIDGFVIQNGKATNGGGILCSSASPIIANNRITANVGSGNGGGIALVNSSAQVLNNQIDGNQATIGAGIFCSAGSALVQSNLIYDNTASSNAGGIHLTGGTPVLLNNTIVANTASMAGAVYNDAALTLINNILASCSSGLLCTITSTLTAKSNCVYGNTSYDYSGVSASSTDVQKDPLFVSASTKDFHLQAPSPCIDTGSDYDSIGSTSDLDGEPRLSGSKPDIGADEFLSNSKVSLPVFYPSAGRYETALQVTLNCNTPGVSIHYTTNGLDPTENDPIVSGSILIDHTMTVKAKAWKSGWIASDVASAAYSLKTATPVIHLASGEYDTPQTVSVTCDTDGAVIHYTTNGIDPTESDPVVTGPISISIDTTLKVKAWRGTLDSSDVASASYTFITKNPEFSPSGGTFNTPQQVTITCATTEAVIHYTTNGNDPTTSDPVVSGSIQVDHPLTLKARSWKTGISPSKVASATYQFKPLAPVFNPGSGSYRSAQEVSISCQTPGVEIHYTLDGSDPTKSSALYQANSTIKVDHPLTIKACAWRSTWDLSDISSGQYDFILPQPSITPNGGSFTDAVTVQVNCSDPLAQIRYTVDGTDPTDSSSLCSGSILISRSVTLKLKSFRTGWIASDTVSAVFIVQNSIAYVNQGNAGSVHDGMSWKTAYTTVEEAVDTSISGEIWVAAGTYPGQCTILKPVSLYGGFNGTETSRSQRDWTLYKTILDGKAEGSVISIPETAEGAVLIDGFTIQNGKAFQGGGISAAHSPVTITHNTIMNNSATYGGGLSGGFIIDNLITINNGDTGSAVYSPEVLDRNRIGSNVAKFSTISLDRNPLVTNNWIYKNDNGSEVIDVYLLRSQTASVCLIANNTLVDNFGSQPIYTKGVTDVLIDGGYSTIGDSVQCIFANNLLADSIGIGIYANQYCAISNNVFYGQTKTYDGVTIKPGTTDLIGSDPKFFNRAGGDYHLKLGSPCIDRGNDTPVQSGWLDIDLQTRIMGAHVDVGADEYLASTPFVTSGGFVKFGRWNLVSIPADPISPDPLVVFQGVNVPNASFQFWNNGAGGGFYSYNPSSGWTGPVVRGIPYWFLETGTGSNKDLQYQGYAPTAAFTLMIPAHTQAPFWVMLGTPFANDVACSTIQFKNAAVNSDYKSWSEAYSLKMVESKALGFDAASQTFFTAGPSNFSPEQSYLKPWFGYWLLVNRPEELLINFPKP